LSCTTVAFVVPTPRCLTRRTTFVQQSFWDNMFPTQKETPAEPEKAAEEATVPSTEVAAEEAVADVVEEVADVVEEVAEEVVAAVEEVAAPAEKTVEEEPAVTFAAMAEQAVSDPTEVAVPDLSPAAVAEPKVVERERHTLFVGNLPFGTNTTLHASSLLRTILVHVSIEYSLLLSL
jgi:hypothetical protein